MKVKIVNKSKHPLPIYATLDSAGMDIRANLESPMKILRGERALIKTGLFISLPQGSEAQLRPRSGLALKNGITLVNTPGTIDSDFVGEIGVILINHGNESFIVNDGDRICQMVIAKHEVAEWEEVETLDETERGSGSFGHTGKR